MQGGREEREKTTVRMCRRFPSAAHTDVALARIAAGKILFFKTISLFQIDPESL